MFTFIHINSRGMHSAPPRAQFNENSNCTGSALLFCGLRLTGSCTFGGGLCECKQRSVRENKATCFIARAGWGRSVACSESGSQTRSWQRFNMVSCNVQHGNQTESIYLDRWRALHPAPWLHRRRQCTKHWHFSPSNPLPARATVPDLRAATGCEEPSATAAVWEREGRYATGTNDYCINGKQPLLSTNRNFNSFIANAVI